MKGSKTILGREKYSARSGHLDTESTAFNPYSWASRYHFSPESNPITRIANCAKSARVSAASVFVFTIRSTAPPNVHSPAVEDDEEEGLDAQRYSASMAETKERERTEETDQVSGGEVEGEWIRREKSE
ncbi:hypothetical protein O6P43_026576 [Quillaja saponaria]|uniref:Uncharacterized protein n=1 Tax=Quillaja saponaria TaxID=32244 RepID=A0AAD7L2H7_QUISA|nr:hypothetical protein O6P43_026576 [Quillaja saponaria]